MRTFQRSKPDRQPFSQIAISILLIAGMCISGLTDLPAEAKKKKGGEDEAAQSAAKAEEELKKGLEPLNTTLMELMTRMESRALLSPEEAGKLVDIRYKLMDLMNEHPTSPLIIKPVYQAATLYHEREDYADAYELFSFLSQGFPAHPYGQKAKSKVAQLEKRFGSDYFPVVVPPPAPETAASEGDGKKPADEAKKK